MRSPQAAYRSSTRAIRSCTIPVEPKMRVSTSEPMTCSKSRYSPFASISSSPRNSLPTYSSPVNAPEIMVILEISSVPYFQRYAETIPVPMLIPAIETLSEPVFSLMCCTHSLSSSATSIGSRRQSSP